MTYFTSIITFTVALLSLAAIRAFRNHRRRGGRPYPPGPPPWPILGNLFDIPNKFSWLAYTQFSKIYGDVLSFHTFGQVVVVLNTADAVKDLLEKRAAIYSDRSVLPIHEMMGWGWILTFARSDDPWRQGRRMLERGLRPGATTSYRSIIQARTHVFLSRLLETPHQWEAHIDLFQGELILAVTYGYQVNGSDDRMVVAVKRLNQFGIEKALPGSLLVNSVPLMRHIPEWLPWLSYKPLARVGRDLGNQVLHPPVQFVKESMLNGTACPSLALENLQELENLNLSGPDRHQAEEMIAGVLGSTYSAGTDTTVGVMKSFFVAMLLYPDIQKKAQEELDSVIGRDRLPTFEDRPRLPFVDAVCKEALRWRVISPLSVPHAVTQDDVYEGFFIPKGAVVIPNTWAILNDPATYPEPDVFKPERFLNTDGSLRDDPMLTFAFGYGKRICPGKHFADATLFLSIASLFSVFNIKKGRDGWDKLSAYTYTGALANYPNSFPCSFIPRDRRAQELILAHTMAR